MPERIQQKRTRGWRMPENTISVARPGRWGNPYVVGAPPARLSAEEVVALYRMHLQSRPDLLATLSQLRGKNLACFCPLGLPCHADVLLEVANA